MENSIICDNLQENAASMFHINIQGLANKADQLSLYLENKNVSVVCLSEHFFYEENANFIKLDRYKLCSYFCRKTNKRGGVAIFTKINLKCKPLDVSDFCSEFNAEFCGVELTSIRIIVITVYRSCLGDFNVFLIKFEELLTYLSTKYKKIIILGDFNIHFEGSSTMLNDFLYLTNSFGIDITITDFTRETGCIDNILTNIESNCYKAEVFDPGLSDHYGQYIHLKQSMDTTSKTVWRRKITGKGINKIKMSLSQIKWANLFTDDLDFM